MREIIHLNISKICFLKLYKKEHLVCINLMVMVMMGCVCVCVCRPISKIRGKHKLGKSCKRRNNGTIKLIKEEEKQTLYREHQ